jgi:ABC-type transporter Mla maintaining outer membrane lipid asymmetry permease subunit MlaE
VEAAGALASLAFACATRPITLYGWASAFFYELNLLDLCSSVIKLTGSGALVAAAAAYLGLKPKSGAEDLGRDVTATIVAATFLVILWHGVWTVLLYG